MKSAEIRELARARKVLNRLAISKEALWIDGFRTGLEAAKAKESEDDMCFAWDPGGGFFKGVTSEAIASLIAEAKEAAKL